MTDEELGYFKGEFDSLKQNIGNIIQTECGIIVKNVMKSYDDKIHKLSRQTKIYSFLGGVVGGMSAWIATKFGIGS